MLDGGLGLVREVVVVVVGGGLDADVVLVVVHGHEFEPVVLTSEHFVLPCRRTRYCRNRCYRRRDYRTVAGIVAVVFGYSQPEVDNQRQKMARRRKKRVAREG